MGTEQGSDAVKELIARGEDADGRTSPGENFRHRIGKRRRPLRRHLSVRRAEMQCERIRKLISRWHRNKLGAERKAAWRKCSKALAPILDIIRKNAVHASLKAVDASRRMPRMTLRLRYRTLTLRALSWVLRRLRASSVNATLRIPR